MMCCVMKLIFIFVLMVLVVCEIVQGVGCDMQVVGIVVLCES